MEVHYGIPPTLHPAPQDWIWFGSHSRWHCRRWRRIVARELSAYPVQYAFYQYRIQGWWRVTAPLWGDPALVSDLRAALISMNIFPS